MHCIHPESLFTIAIDDKVSDRLTVVDNESTCHIDKTSDTMMDRLLDVQTPEAKAYTDISQDALWYTGHSLAHDNDYSLPPAAERTMALFASYAAFVRYIAGEDLYVRPRSTLDLLRALNRYAHDAIHNLIAYTRVPLADGGYRRVCSHAERSIRKVLRVELNRTLLLKMHGSACEKEEAEEENRRLLLRMHGEREREELMRERERERDREEIDMMLPPPVATI